VLLLGGTETVYSTSQQRSAASDLKLACRLHGRPPNDKCFSSSGSWANIL